MKPVWLAGLTIAILGAVHAHHASAQHKAAPAKRKAGDAPKSAEIAASMGDLRWGMTKADLVGKVETKTKTKYDTLLAKVRNPVDEDRLRSQESDELAAVRKGYVEFNGTTTGWDVSYLKGEFAHNTGESMLVVRDRNSQNFYFFLDGKLWKWYKAFDAEVFPADDFKAFQASVEKRFGPAKLAHGEPRPGAGERQWLEWQDGSTRLRAIDETSFYGFYCLVFEQKSTSDQMVKVRGKLTDSGPKGHALVESVTAPREGHLDSSPDIADRLSGHTRGSAEPAAPSVSRGERTSAQQPTRAAEPRPAAQPASTRTQKSDDDPLSGLGL